ncbi:exported hypothetical protein [Candidatus Zixiibacteriota bacterium]|nr:exported hypothetical protein [candidate division Zixibacteria bacterium]
MKLRAILSILLLLALAVVTITGCSSNSTSNKSDGTLQVSSVTASPASISVGSTSVVEAEISDGTNPLSNRVVTFSVTPEGSGYFTPAFDTSDADGIVASIFTATQTGSAVLTATVSSTSRNVSVSIVSSGHSGTGNVDLAVTPSMLLADGLSTSQVTVTVRDANAQPVPDSTVVRLVAGEKFVDVDNNGYFTSGVDSVVYDAIPNGHWDAIGFIPSTAVTSGGTGQAVVNYTSGTEAVSVYIRATVDDPSVSGNAETSVQLTPNASIASISMMAQDIHMAVKSTGGIENSAIYATGYDANGNPVPEGLQISFIITDGPGGGEHLGVSGYGPYVASTNAMGVAKCPIASGTISGTVRIRAYSDTVLSNATQIMVHAGPPAHIIVGAEACNVQYWGWINKKVQVTAVASDIYHNPVADSTAIYFSCDEGTIMAHEARTEDEQGIATSWWISGYEDPAADGIVEVFASTNGGTLADTGYFTNSWLPDTLWFVNFPGSIICDGKTSKTFYLEIRDVNGNYVLDQTEIDLEADLLNVASGVVQDGCTASRVKTFLTSVVLGYDYSITGSADDGIGAIDFVTASYKSVAGVGMPCTLLTGPAYYSGCILDVPQTVNYSTTVPISATIKDRWGNPLGDHLLVASITGGGTISNGSQRTNMYGEASGFLYNAPADTTIKSVILQLHDLDLRGSITMTKTISLSK